MDAATRISSPPSIRINYDPNQGPDRYRSTSRSSSYNSTSQSIVSGPMSIPNAKEYVPPPLPPPRHIPELKNGSDMGWQWGNENNGSFGKSVGSVKPGSSLYRGFSRPSNDDGEQESEGGRRESSASTITSPPETDLRQEGLRHPDEGYASLSGSSLANLKLQGERPLEYENRKTAVQAYDKNVLSRFGSAKSEPLTRNPHTPPHDFRLSGFASQDASPTSKSTFDHGGRHPSQLRPLSMPDANVSPESRHPPINGLHSAGMSPRHTSSASISQGYVDFRSPTNLRNSHVSQTTDTERYQRSRDHHARRSGSSSIYSIHDDDSSIASRSNRGSYDHSFMEADADSPMEEAGMKQLNLGDRAGDRTPPHSDGLSAWAIARSGLKRRASSPPREPARESSREDRLSLSAINNGSDLSQRRTSGPLPPSRSPVPRLFPHHGSVSSTSSARHGSLASSVGLSAAGSSMTSISSYDRPSPGGISPGPEMDLSQDSPYVTSVNPSPRGSMSRAHQQRTFSESKSATTSRKHSVESPAQLKQNTPSKIQGVHICECCPKKPKKFDSPEELQFKNKNEAERHQNSLHLRRHSWSCAALSGVEAAFHSSTIHPASADVCGYCGDEYSIPANWDARVEHLTTVHKFGECNQAKKFFRADHFRQHLKHSHAGTSGKWTNMLENACMKDEPVLERVGSIGGSGSDGRGPNNMGGIDEGHEES
ncbi:MAG: hypothetical protein M1827_002874 [Pycnora praestabilis]|nr:MAG: hypothetical protein M1827_002874 [Pycnora praestabilis]